MNPGRWLIVGGDRSFPTPWFPRQEDNVWITYEIIQTIGAPTFSVEVFHKDRDEQGSALDAGHKVSVTFSQVSGTNLYTGKCCGLRELVRLNFEVLTEGGPEGVMYRVLPFAWFPSAR
jgi:hypothetical protein